MTLPLNELGIHLFLKYFTTLQNPISTLGKNTFGLDELIIFAIVGTIKNPINTGIRGIPNFLMRLFLTLACRVWRLFVRACKGCQDRSSGRIARNLQLVDHQNYCSHAKP